MFIEAKDNESGGESWSYRSCKAPVKSLPLVKKENTSGNSTSLDDSMFDAVWSSKSAPASWLMMAFSNELLVVGQTGSNNSSSKNYNSKFKSF